MRLQIRLDILPNAPEPSQSEPLRASLGHINILLPKWHGHPIVASLSRALPTAH
ncbi:MAG UNVERIFIED_CONTAM: hypothetical protein LVT10_09620 [Anaerolineae bacterium]